MTIPTDGRIDLDALAELAQRLRNSPYMKALATEAADAIDNLIDLARRAAIPSEQGEAVLRWDLEPVNVQGFLVISATESPDGRWVKAEDALRAALPPSPAVVPSGWKLVPVEPTEAMTKAGFGPFLAAHDPFFNKNEPTAPIYRAMLSVSPSPPALDGAGREGWQPIETAPKDGTTILAWGPYNLEPCTVRWGPQRVGKEGWNSTWDGSRVIASETDFGTEYAEPDPLSHWMPLPAPPKETP